MLLIGKQFDQEKQRLFIQQNGICPLCGRPLDADVGANHLDHDHILTGPNAGKVRALLCVHCNALEGQILHKFNTSGLKSAGIDISEYLVTLAKYYNADLSGNRIHPRFIADKTCWFKRLNKDEMFAELDAIKAVYDPKLTKEKLVPIYKKALRLFYKD